MKNTFSFFAAIVGLAILATGCASGPSFAEYRSHVQPPAEGFGRVWFYRPSVLGMAVQPPVELDSRTVGNAVPRGFFHADVLPGEHTVKCTTEWTHAASINVNTNCDSYVRLKMMMGVFVGHVIPEEEAESKAVAEMQGLHLVEHN